MNQQQQFAIDYLREENRVLKEQLGCRRLRLNDDQRRRLAAKAKRLGRRILAEVASIVTPETLFGVAPETDRPQIRRNCPARAGATSHRRRDRGFGGSNGRREPGLGLPAHSRRALQSRLPNRARDRRQYSETAWD